MTTFKKILFYSILGIFAVIGLFGTAKLIATSLDKSEVVECLQWKDWSEEYAPQFFLLKWQDEQCRAHNIIINAPVRE